MSAFVIYLVFRVHRLATIGGLIFGVSAPFQHALELREKRSGVENLIEKLSGESDKRRVDNGGEERAESYAVEASVGDCRPIKLACIAEKKERECY